MHFIALNECNNNDIQNWTTANSWNIIFIFQTKRFCFNDIVPKLHFLLLLLLPPMMIEFHCDIAIREYTIIKTINLFHGKCKCIKYHRMRLFILVQFRIIVCSVKQFNRCFYSFFSTLKNDYYVRTSECIKNVIIACYSVDINWPCYLTFRFISKNQITRLNKI